jgi:glutamate racemase
MDSNNPIGIFDSGVGGLSIFRAIRDLLSNENLVYVADQAHVPYGNRTLQEVRSFAEGITLFLKGMNAKLIVIACNAASAAALQYLRQKYTGFAFVGMEPAVKPAAQQTRTQRVGILGTQATFQGALYASVIERFASGVKVYENTCPGLVGQIEKGELNSDDTRKILIKAIQPMKNEGIDTIVLGCTHYPFVIPLIREIAGSEINVIDPSPAIARQTQRLLKDRKLLNPQNSQGTVSLYTTASPAILQSLLPRLIGMEVKIQSLSWKREAQGNLKLLVNQSS